ncbi:MAG: peroxiredoxin family protein [Butyricimonas paravirosa]
MPDTEGKFVLIDFWGPSCSPCRKSIPDLNRFSKQFKDKLVVIGVSLNKEEQVRAMKEPVISIIVPLTRRKSISVNSK